MKFRFTPTKPLLLAVAALAFAVSASAADKLGPKVKLSCTFPPAEGVQKVKPGKPGVSDGVVRIGALTQVFDICNGCKWPKDTAKWKVDAESYAIKTHGGIELTISRKDGSAVFIATSREDEYYLSGRAESQGKCTPAAK